MILKEKLNRLFAIVFIALVLPLMLLPKQVVVKTADSTFVKNFFSDNDNIYLKTTDFSAILNGKLVYNEREDKYVIKYNNKKLGVFPESPFISVNGEVRKLRNNVLRDDTECLIPLISNIDVISKLINKRIIYDSKNNVLKIFDSLYDIIGLKLENAKNSTIISFDLAPIIKYKYKMKGRYFNVYFYTKSINSSILSKKFSNSLISSSSIKKWKKGIYLSFKLKSQTYVDDVIYSEESGILQFIMRSSKYVKKEASVGKGEIIIVIDPGHGGKDSGAVGPGGTKEKDIVLKISKILRNDLSKYKNFKIYLTRYDDRFVSLRERTEFALKKKAALFISIHCNAALNRKSKHARGFETYFLSLSRTSWERAVASRENASILYETERDKTHYNTVDYILSDMAQNQSLIESSKLAEYIQNSLANSLNLKDRGVHQAGFYVLRLNYMPAVLVEAAFISNTNEEKLLKQPWFRKKVSKSICKGIVDFVSGYKKRIYGK